MVGGILVNYLFFQESKIHWLVCVSFKRAGSFTSMLLSEHLVLLSVSDSDEQKKSPELKENHIPLCQNATD